jgi:cytochrome P450
MRITVPGGEDVDVDAAALHDPAWYADGDPHPVWRVLRERDPLHRHVLPDGRSYRSVTRHADVQTVLRDHGRFTSRRGTLLSVLGAGGDPAADKMMAASDPPVHTAMRVPLMRVLSHGALQQRQPAIRRVVLRLLRPMRDGEPWDLAAAAVDFPMAFTGALMGLPEEDWPRLAALTTLAIAPEESTGVASGAEGSIVLAHHDLFEYFADRLASHDGADDLVGHLRTMPVAGRRMRSDEIVYNCYSLLLGANVTTPHAIAASVVAFTEHPDQYRRLVDGDVGIASAVEEALRWSSPANHFLRHVVEDAELAGERLAKGEAVVTWLGSANRDERVFADPYRFDVGRAPNRHLAFGHGPHYCIGAPLARIALRAFYTELVRRVGSFELAGPVTHLRSNFTAGIRRLPVAARLRRDAA